MYESAIHKSTRRIMIAATALVAAVAAAAAPQPVSAGTPVVVAGKALPYLLGKPVSSIRVLDMSGKAIPFQVDEVTADGEYVLDKGEAPNSGDGNSVLDRQDEIVFLWGDAGAYTGADTNAAANIDANADKTVSIAIGRESRAVIIASDPSIPLSPKRYVEYNDGTRRVVTPYYYADFAKDRFHFLRAGVKDFGVNRYIDLTNELRVEILLRALFGLVPIRYTEDNIVCFVRRYKTGPIRLIRRGDFHLNLGMGVKGSRAAVNQICYPQIVEVPVHVSLPVRFRTLFSQAHIEMTPVIRGAGRNFKFSVPSENIIFSIGGPPLDTLSESTPAEKMFALSDGVTGYGWLLNTTMDPSHLSGSGWILRRPPPERRGIAECGFRLTVRDVPRGSYRITNRVMFSGGKPGDIEALGQLMNLPVRIGVGKHYD